MVTRLLLYLRRFELPLLAWATKMELAYHLTMRALGVDDFNDERCERRGVQITMLAFRGACLDAGISFVEMGYAADRLTTAFHEFHDAYTESLYRGYERY